MCGGEVTALVCSRTPISVLRMKDRENPHPHREPPQGSLLQMDHQRILEL